MGVCKLCIIKLAVMICIFHGYQWRNQSLSGVAHPEGLNEKETYKRLRKNMKKLSTFEERMRKVKFLPIQDSEAG